MFATVAAQLGAVFVVVICLFAFLKGDEPERIGAGAYVLGWLGSLLTQDAGGLNGPQYGIFALDLAMLIVLCGLAWKSRRSWPAWAAGLQLLSITSNLFMIFDNRASMGSLFAVLNLTGYGVLICIGVGTFWAWQNRRAAGLE